MKHQTEEKKKLASPLNVERNHVGAESQTETPETLGKHKLSNMYTVTTSSTGRNEPLITIQRKDTPTFYISSFANGYQLVVFSNGRRSVLINVNERDDVQDLAFVLYSYPSPGKRTLSFYKSDGSFDHRETESVSK